MADTSGSTPGTERSPTGTVPEPTSHSPLPMRWLQLKVDTPITSCQHVIITFGRSPSEPGCNDDAWTGREFWTAM